MVNAKRGSNDDDGPQTKYVYRREGEERVPPPRRNAAEVFESDHRAAHSSREQTRDGPSDKEPRLNYPQLDTLRRKKSLVKMRPSTSRKRLRVQSSDDSLCSDCVRSLNRLRTPCRHHQAREDGGDRHRQRRKRESRLKQRKMDAALNLDRLPKRTRDMTENATRSPPLDLNNVASSLHDQKEQNVRGPDVKPNGSSVNLDVSKTNLDDPNRSGNTEVPPPNAHGSSSSSSDEQTEN